MMKRSNLFSRLSAAFTTALRFWCEHAAVFEVIEKRYAREWREEGTDGLFSVQIRIIRCGSVYHVAQSFYFNDSYIKDVTWLATYTWSAGGYLVALGSDRYLFFDPLQKQLYLEDWPDGGLRTLDKYKQI